MYRLCYSFLGSAADAEDATQSVFMKLIDRPRRFNDPEHEKAWLIVSPEPCRDVLKRARTRQTALPKTSRTRGARQERRWMRCWQRRRVQDLRVPVLLRGYRTAEAA
ncbi:MAG: RNA polymerase sigma factor [Eggerthella lenta]